MNPDERHELLHDASDLAYVHIKFSGLYRELSSEQWERLAQGHAEKVVGLLEGLVDREFTRIEDEKENVWLNQD